jgi:hypothetical protein
MWGRSSQERLVICIGLALVLAACTGDTARSSTTAVTEEAEESVEPSTTETSVVDVGSVTITDSECQMAIDSEDAGTGPLAFMAINDSGVQAAVDVFHVTDIAAVVAHVDEERRRADSGEPVLGHPGEPIATFASSGSGLLDAGTSTQVVVEADEPGDYAVICLRYHENTSDPVRPFAVVGPFTVEG